MAKDTESSSTVWSSLQTLVYQVVQLIDIRLALIIGLVAFLVAVSFDAAGNPAAAADMAANRSAGAMSIPSVTVVSGASLSANGAQASQARIPTSGLASDSEWATAQRLRHGTLTSALMTNNRLTQAHFFTDLPSR